MELLNGDSPVRLIILDPLKKEAARLAERMGRCDPSWLDDDKDPDFNVRYANDEQASNSDLGDAGRELILLHGLMGAISNWDSTLPLFGKFCKPMALHFPILTAPRSDVKVKALAVYTWFYCQRQKLNPVALCGNSLGGHIALRMYLADPSSIDCLILAGTSGLYEHSVDSLPVRPSREFVREHMARVFVNPDFITEEAIEDMYSILSKRNNVRNLIHAARSAKRDNLLEYLPTISCPTLLLWGEDDDVTPMDVAETFHKHMPNSELVTIKNCGHAPMIEHPDWFAEQVKNFLEKQKKHDTLLL